MDPLRIQSYLHTLSTHDLKQDFRFLARIVGPHASDRTLQYLRAIDVELTIKRNQQQREKNSK